MAKWLTRQTRNHNIVDLSSAEASWFIKKSPMWAMNDRNATLVHSATNEYLPLDRDPIVLRSPVAP